MKNLLLLIATICISFNSIAQQKRMSYTSIGAPIPNFVISKTNGGTLATQQLKAGKPVMIMIFSPECDHCEHFVDSMKGIKSKFKTTQLIMVAEERHKAQMPGFIAKTKIKSDPLFSNIGTNRGELIGAIYTNKVLPQIVFYDANHKLVKIFDGQYLLKDVAKYIK